MGNSSKRDIKKLDRAVLARDALELRREGKSYEEIAAKIGLKRRQRAYELISGAIAAIPRENAESVRQLELFRLDAMWKSICVRASKGDLDAIQVALRIMKRRAEYLGLDAPKNVHQTHLLVQRELDSALDKLQAELTPDEYKRVLNILASGAGETPA